MLRLYSVPESTFEEEDDDITENVSEMVEDADE